MGTCTKEAVGHATTTLSLAGCCANVRYNEKSKPV
jgi:hypothetical protein